MPFLHQRHHTENPDRLKSSLPGSQQLGTSVEYLDRVDETCTSDIFLGRVFITGCSGLLLIDKKDVRQPETFLFLPGQKSIMVATFPATCSGVLWDGMFHGFNQFGLLFL